MDVGRAPVMMTNLQHFWILGLKNDPLFDRHYTPHRKTELLLAQVEPPRRPLALRVYRHARPTVPHVTIADQLVTRRILGLQSKRRFGSLRIGR
jgi:hypothetical protein